jgi:uncharacterized protein YqgQ
MKSRYLAGAFMLLAVSVAYGRDVPDYQAYSRATPVASATAPGAANRPIPGRVLYEDEQRGVPTFIWANPRRVHKTPYHGQEESARWYLSQFSDAYGLTKASLDTVYVRRVHDTGRGGIIVFFGQRVSRVEVMRNELKVLMKRDLSLVAISREQAPRLHPILRERPGSGPGRLHRHGRDRGQPAGHRRQARRVSVSGHPGR